MSAKATRAREFELGQRIFIKLSDGHTENATVRAVIDTSDGRKLQVDFGHDQTALIHVRQVIED
jgi:hypothetical protein